MNHSSIESISGNVTSCWASCTRFVHEIGTMFSPYICGFWKAKPKYPKLIVFTWTGDSQTEWFSCIWWHFWLSWVGGCYWHLVGRSQGTCQTLKMHRLDSSQIKNGPVEHVNGAEDEKPWIRPKYFDCSILSSLKDTYMWLCGSKSDCKLMGIFS